MNMRRKKIATSITISVEIFNKVQRHLDECMQCRSFSEGLEHLAKVGYARLLEFKQSEFQEKEGGVYSRE